MGVRVHIAAAAVLVLALGAFRAGAAQVAVTTADIQRLQDAVYDVSGEISRMRARDAELATRLQAELDEVRDEVIYLRVKMRKEGSVARGEYTAVRDRLNDIRARALGAVAAGTAGTTGSEPASPATRTPAAAGPNTVPVGTEIDIRLQTQLSSETAQVEDRFEATTIVDIQRGDGRVLIPAGSVVRGVVTSVDPAGRIDRTGRLTVNFDEITIGRRSYPIRGTVTQALESGGIREEAARIGTGGAVGAIIGGILGGVRGALAGILIGAGGTIAATEGKDVVLPPGTVLRMRLDTPITVQ